MKLIINHRQLWVIDGAWGGVAPPPAQHMRNKIQKEYMPGLYSLSKTLESTIFEEN